MLFLIFSIMNNYKFDSNVDLNSNFSDKIWFKFFGGWEMSYWCLWPACVTSAYFASLCISFFPCFCFHSAWNRTRGSPDSTRLSGSSGSTSTTPSQRAWYQRRLFWPLHLWTRAPTTAPSAPEAENAQRGNPRVKVEISQPVPLRPTKLQTTGQNGMQPILWGITYHCLELLSKEKQKKKILQVCFSLWWEILDIENAERFPWNSSGILFSLQDCLKFLELKILSIPSIFGISHDVIDS